MKNIATILSLMLLLNNGFASDPTLKEAYNDIFYIGAAINAQQILEMDTNGCKLIASHFNSITAENEMKWERIHPRNGVYNFDLADKFVALGEKNNMFIVGHCLLWHQQTPDWVFTDSLGNLLTREALLERLRDHITKIVSRYKGKIDGYDVVNEALNEDGSMRKSKWYNIIGEDYIEKAFEYANAADPKTELYYNDYNIEMPAKRAGAIRIIKNLQAKGIKIDGVGIQGHWHLNSPSAALIDTSIIQFDQLGIKVHITEFDISVLPNPEGLSGAEISKNFELKKGYDLYTYGLPDSVQLIFTNRILEIFNVFVKYKSTVARVTTWGVDDSMSWLNDWPIKKRTNYPLLFDRNYMAKPVVGELIKIVK